ncbi:MAG: D-tyrosyl-tRNA(Tyr) deacylase [candidate division Zixibacteria bacterium SM23_81]|nr:MAG: D-tyrosyl-tRNA(Tyr) deacylase [candidate division Zixibacteria bacterium SM23_81]
MKIVVQRVSEAEVAVSGQSIGRIGAGLVLLVGMGHNDTEQQVRYLGEKCLNLRIFEDQEGKMNRSLMDVGGEILAISQFTLYGDTRKGRRPGFSDAAPPEKAEPLYERFVELLRAAGIKVKTGSFGAHMLVRIHNDGPVTLILEA